jgi:hypothetical protein
MAFKAFILGVEPGSRELPSERARMVQLADPCIFGLKAEMHCSSVIADPSAGIVRGGRHADTLFAS